MWVQGRDMGHGTVQGDYDPNGDRFGQVAGCQWHPSLSRPMLLNTRNGTERVVLAPNGKFIRNSKTGRQEAQFKAMRIPDLQRRGINSPVFNATALRKEEWIELDRVVLRAARFRLRAWADLATANSFGGFPGMSKMILEHETMSDPGEALVDMDALTEGRTDSPMFQLQGLPLPITHCDFWYDARRLAISRNTGTPLDTTMGEAAGRRVAESVEKVTIGVDTGITYGGNSTQVGGYGRNSSVYGYLNFPPRVTSVTGYSPTGNGRAGTGWVPLDTVKDVLAVLQAMYKQKFYGPFMIYHSNDWDQYLDQDYFLTSTATNTPISTKTLRQRLAAIGSDDDPAGTFGNERRILGVRRLDFLAAETHGSGAYSVGGVLYPDPAYILTTNPFKFIFVQMTPDVARGVNGMDITTVQWESQGGMRINFKVMAIQVPQLRADFYGNCGIAVTAFTL